MRAKKIKDFALQNQAKSCKIRNKTATKHDDHTSAHCCVFRFSAYSPVGVLGSNLVEQWRTGAVFLVITKYLPLTRSGPRLAGRDSLRELRVNLTEILDAVTEQSNLSASGRNSSDQVIALADKRLELSYKCPILARKIPIANGDRLGRPEASLRGDRRSRMTPETRVEGGAGRILAKDLSLFSLPSSCGSATRALHLVAAEKQVYEEVQQSHCFSQKP
jgi:hypothetical protein